MRSHHQEIVDAYHMCLRSDVPVRALDVTAALWALFIFRRRVSRSDILGCFKQLMPAGHPPASSESGLSAITPNIARLVKAANIASLLYAGGQQCLSQAYALAYLFAKHHVDNYEVCIGVTRTPPIEFHAWIELCGKVLSDDEYHVRRRFTRMPITRSLCTKECGNMESHLHRTRALEGTA